MDLTLRSVGRESRMIQCTFFNALTARSSLLKKMRVNVMPGRTHTHTHTHKDLGRIRIIHKPIIAHHLNHRLRQSMGKESVRLECSRGIVEGSKQLHGRGGMNSKGRHRLRSVSGGMCGVAFRLQQGFDHPDHMRAC